MNRYNCLSPYLLTSYIEQELSPRDRVEVAEHLQLCERCSALHSEQRRLHRQSVSLFWRVEGLSSRTARALARANVDSWANLHQLSAPQLYRKAGIGEKAVAEIQALTARRGLSAYPLEERGTGVAER